MPRPPAAGRRLREVARATVGARPSISSGRVRGGRARARRARRRRGRPRRRRRCRRRRRSARVDPSRAAARRISPGAGLRHSQPSSGPCGQYARGPSGPSSASMRAWTAATSSRVEQPAGDAALVGDDRDADAGGAQPGERLARAGHRLDARRVAVVGDVGDQRAVAVEQHRRRQGAGRGARRPPAGAARAATARAATMPWRRRASRRSSRASSRPRRGVRGPGAIRAQASSAVPASQRRAAPRRRPRARRRGQRAERGGAGARSIGEVARGGGRAGTPARSRQPRPCSARISTSSALPACLATRSRRAPGATGCSDVARARDDPPARARSRAGRGRRPRGRRAGSARRSRRPPRAPSRR